jgi:hypothetical protein
LSALAIFRDVPEANLVGGPTSIVVGYNGPGATYGDDSSGSEVALPLGVPGDLIPSPSIGAFGPPDALAFAQAVEMNLTDWEGKLMSDEAIRLDVAVAGVNLGVGGMPGSVPATVELGGSVVLTVTNLGRETVYLGQLPVMVWLANGKLLGGRDFTDVEALVPGVPTRLAVSLPGQSPWIDPDPNASGFDRYRDSEPFLIPNPGSPILVAVNVPADGNGRFDDDPLIGELVDWPTWIGQYSP